MQQQQQHHQWLSEELVQNDIAGDPTWTESLAVGGKTFVNVIHTLLENKAKSRLNTDTGGKYLLREMSLPYIVNIESKSGSLSSNNLVLWDKT